MGGRRAWEHVGCLPELIYNCKAIASNTHNVQCGQKKKKKNIVGFSLTDGTG